MANQNKRPCEVAGEGDVICVPRIPNYIAGYREGVKDIYSFVYPDQKTGEWEPTDNLINVGPNLSAPENKELFLIRQQRQNHVSKIWDPSLSEAPSNDTTPNDHEGSVHKTMTYSSSTSTWTEYHNGVKVGAWTYVQSKGGNTNVHFTGGVCLKLFISFIGEQEFWLIDYKNKARAKIAVLPPTAITGIIVEGYKMYNDRAWDPADPWIVSPDNRALVSFRLSDVPAGASMMGPNVGVLYIGYAPSANPAEAVGGLWIQTPETSAQKQCSSQHIARDSSSTGGLSIGTTRVGEYGYFIWSTDGKTWSQTSHRPPSSGYIPVYHQYHYEYHTQFDNLAVYLVNGHRGWKYFNYDSDSKELTWLYLDVPDHAHFFLVDPRIATDGFIGWFEDRTRRVDPSGVLRYHVYKLYSREVPDLLGGTNQAESYIIQSEQASGFSDAQTALVRSYDGEGTTLNYVIWPEKVHNTDLYVFDTETDKGDCWPTAPFYKVVVQPDAIIFYFKEYAMHALESGMLIAMPELGIEGDWAPTVAGAVAFPSEIPYNSLLNGDRLINATMGAAV